MPPHATPKTQNKGKKPQQSNKPTIAKELEQRELLSCKSRIKSEFKLFSQLNPGAFRSQLQLTHEPKLVKLDSEFGSQARNRSKGPKVKVTQQTLYNSDDQQQPQQQPKALDSMPMDYLRTFQSLPISTRTKRALGENGFNQCTRVQHASLPSSLANRDLFVLSCTGSGKTLAFLIPVLETLWQQRWTRELGLGALIIEPTRELALQTFHALRRIGAYHDYSAGLLIGGTSFEEERAAIAGMNILVCTPGRLIHHLEQSYGLDLTNIVSLVIDECDHLLDIGFAEQFEVLAPLLPTKKKLANTTASTSTTTTTLNQGGPVGLHSMLFSATMNPQVQKFAKRVLSPDLQMISLGSVSGNNPDNLAHRFLVVPETEKVHTLFEFLRVHRSNKSVVFASTARQVSYLYELFRGLSINAPVHRLHSKLGHHSRTQEYYQFQQEKFGVLICTDVAARGLDFTGVSYVIHFDCPVNVTQYTHRSGRTARLKGCGTNLLMLSPHQLRFAHLLHISNPTLKLQQIGLPQFRSQFYAKMAQLYSEHPTIKTSAEKAVISYMQHLIHERNECGDVLSQLIPDPTTRKSTLRTLSTDLLFLAKKKSVVIKKLTTASPTETTAFFYNLFDISKYDVIGLCRGYGLQSVPIVVSVDAQNDLALGSDDEGENKPSSENKNKKATRQLNNNNDEDDGEDQELGAITRVNAELAEFVKRARLLAKSTGTAGKENGDDMITKSKTQPKAVDYSGLHHNNDDSGEIICDIFTTWSDNEADDGEDNKNKNTRAKVTFDPQDNIFEQLKQRYKQIDLGDKVLVKDLAIKKRRIRQNMAKLEKLRGLGYRLTLEQLQDMLEQKKRGEDYNLDAYKRRPKATVMNDDDDEDQDDILAGLGDSDDDDDEAAEEEDVEQDFGSFGVGNDDDDDDDSDEGNEFHQMMKREAMQKQQQQQKKSLPSSLLNEDSSDDDSDVPFTKQPIKRSQPQQSKQTTTQKSSTASLMGMDSDDDDDSDEEEERIVPVKVVQPVKLTKEEKKQEQIAQRRLKNQASKEARLERERRDFQSKRINLNETDSDSDEEESTPANKKPAPKKFLNLDETSSDDDSSDDDDVAPAVVNQHGKRVAPTQLQPKVSAAPKAPAAAAAPTTTRRMRKL